MKSKSPDLALVISLALNFSFFFLSFTYASAPAVLSFALAGLTICCLVTDGYGQYYNREHRKGLKLLAWSALYNHEGESVLECIFQWLGFVIFCLCVVSRFACGIRGSNRRLSLCKTDK